MKVACWILALAQFAFSHPVATECSNDADTRVTPGQKLMGMYVTPNDDSNVKISFSDEKGAPITSYSVGQTITVNASGFPQSFNATLSNGNIFTMNAFRLIRASGQAGNFTIPADQNWLAKKCNSQIYTPNDMPPKLPTESIATWKTDVQAGDVIFSAVWSAGPVDIARDKAYMFYTESTLKGPAPPTPAEACTCCQKECTRVLQDGFQMQWKVDLPAKELDVTLTYNKPAWIGFGFSSKGQMVGSEAVIYKPTAPATTQVYQLGGYTPSDIKVYSEDKFTQLSGEQKDGTTTLKFRRPFSGLVPVDLSDDFFLYAAGKDNTWEQHAVKFSGSISYGNNGGSDNPTMNKDMVTAHAILMTLAWGVLLPVGVFSARYLKGNPIWFKVHRACNALGALFTLIAFALIVAAYSQANKANFDILHGKIGLAVFIGACINPILAAIRPHPTPKTLWRLTWEWLHVKIGYVCLGLAWVNGVLGLKRYAGDTMSVPLEVVFYGGVTLSVLLFLFYETKLVQLRAKGEASLNGGYSPIHGSHYDATSA
mmetsp:Transcript_8157/g.15592  ORF Transcript_8157/g.15592 Transcript_8157/m.15592 type:complete len:540 (-) Transcript_8157:182-1801(-)